VSFQLIYYESYLKRAKQFAKQHPDLKEQYRKALRLIEKIHFIDHCGFTPYKAG
jgi:hypothetical protein